MKKARSNSSKKNPKPFGNGVGIPQNKKELVVTLRNLSQDNIDRKRKPTTTAAAAESNNAVIPTKKKRREAAVDESFIHKFDAVVKIMLERMSLPKTQAEEGESDDDDNDINDMADEQEKEEWEFKACFGRPHPLLIPNVMNKIFRNLPFDEMKNCRLVCKAWNAEIYRIMRENVIVSFTNYKRVKDFTENYLGRREFCTDYAFGRGLNIGAPTMKKFFENYGLMIKTLSLQQTKWKEQDLTAVFFNHLTNVEDLTMDCFVPKANDNGHYFQHAPVKAEPGIDLDMKEEPVEVVEEPMEVAAEVEVENDEECLSKLFNLKKLNVNVHAIESPYVLSHPNSTTKTFLLDLFKITPNLETITCPKSEQSYQPLEFLFPLDPVHVNHFINGEVLDALDELNGMGFETNMRRILFDTLVTTTAAAVDEQGQQQQQLGVKLDKLSNIDMSLTLREEHIRKLHVKHFPLRCLDIIITQNITLNTLHGFLSSIGNTLKILSLRFLRRSNCTTEFPSSFDLVKLEELSLTGFKGSLSFLQQFHQLQKFILIKPPTLAAVFPLNDFDFGPQSPLTKLHTLEISEIERSSFIRNYRPQLIQKIAKNFPNLKKFALEYVGDSTLRAIYEYLPNIEQLVLRYGEFTDSAVVGIHQRECDDIRKRGKLGEEELILQRQFKFIGHLRKLKVLELMSKEMTDVGLILGIFYCPALTDLSIMAYGVTDRSLRKISDDMYQLKSFKAEQCNQLTIKGVAEFDARMKAKGKQCQINEYDGPMASTDMWKFLKRNNRVALQLHRLPN